MPGEKPKPKAPDWLYQNIAETSKNARNIFLLYLGILSYSALTVITTDDRQLVLNEAARLPIINMDIPLPWFFIAAPGIMIMTFVYLNLYLMHLQKLTFALYHDYEPDRDIRLYPWMFNIAKNPLQKVFVNLTLWYYQPLVLMLFAVWILKRHELVFSVSVGLMPALGLIVVLGFWWTARVHRLNDVIEGASWIGRVLANTWRFLNVHYGKIALLIVVIGFEIWFFSWAIPMAQRGEVFVVDLSYQMLVQEPDVDYEGIYWLDLRGAHLEGANLRSSILKRADLRGAYLQGASLRDLNLESANVSGADLNGADLGSANLWGAELEAANLARANLNIANFVEANLARSNLSGANLLGANFTRANLINTDLEGANLSVADLSFADLRSAQLIGANLSAADLSFADLRNAQLIGANLFFADLTGADLTGADLSNALNLEEQQLSSVKTLYRTKLPPDLEASLKETHPELFEPPPNSKPLSLKPILLALPSVLHMRRHNI